MRLEGRRILITGAASGIGRATAELFRAEGAAVALLDRDGVGLPESGTGVFAAVVDVTDADGVSEAVAAAAGALGGLDGIVSSAGIDLLKPFDEMTLGEWEQVMAINLTGPFAVCLAAIPHLKEAGKGTIVHISSGAGLRPLPGRTAYCASKAGLVMFAKALAMDLGPHAIRVNAICPGIIETPLFRQSIDRAEDPEAELDRVLDRYVIRRIGKPSDIAYAALYLSCEESAHVTGTTLAVDGGRTFH